MLVVLVDFPGSPMVTPASHFDELFFSMSAIATGSVNEYYKEVTNNSISIQGQVLGPFTMPNSLAYYANGHSGTANTAPNARDLANDAAIAIGPAINLAPVDNNGDGYVDAFVIIHAGSGAEVTGGISDIWSHKAWRLSTDIWISYGS